MDIKDIIKWFIPCLLLLFKFKNGMRVFVFLFLITKIGAVDSNFDNQVTRILDGWTSEVENLTKAVNDFNRNNNIDLSDYFPCNDTGTPGDGKLGYEVAGVPRTFGRPLKKLQMAMIPLAFQIGVASTWMFVSTLLSLKGVFIGVTILKLLLIAGAAKIGALFAHKKEHASPPAWTPQKEVHLHIHNTPHAEAEHTHSFEEIHGHGHSQPVWSRDGGGVVDILGTGTNNPTAFQPVSVISAGPQTINTPYGSYVRVGPSLGGVVRKKRFTPPRRLYVNVF